MAHRESGGADSTLHGRGARPVCAKSPRPHWGCWGDCRQPGWWLSLSQEGWALGSAGRRGQDQQWVWERRDRRGRQAGQMFQVDPCGWGRGESVGVVGWVVEGLAGS